MYWVILNQPVENLVKYILIILIFATFPLYLFAVSPNDQTEIDLANKLDKQANLYYKQGRYAEAEPLYKRSLAIREKILGSDHPVVSNSLYYLARLYDNQGRYTEAEPLYKRSLTIDEKVFGPEHKYIATNLYNLAVLYNKQGRYAEAEPL